MKTVSLSGSLREGVGKKDAAGLRASGHVPGVLYGGKDQTHFKVKDLELKKIVFSPDAYQIDLEIGGKTSRCIIQELQFHPVTDRIQHIDLLLLSEDVPVKVKLPVRTQGTSPGVMTGGRLAINYRNIAVKGLPKDLPESITLDISNLQVLEDIRVRDVQIKGCQILEPAAAVIVAVKPTRASIAAGAAAGTEGAK